jgi:hypothetical protein
VQRRAVAGAHVEHPRPAPQLADHPVEGRQPLVEQARPVTGRVEPVGPGEEAGVAVVPAEALAGAERLGDPIGVG